MGVGWGGGRWGGGVEERGGGGGGGGGWGGGSKLWQGRWPLRLSVPVPRLIALKSCKAMPPDTQEQRTVISVTVRFADTLAHTPLSFHGKTRYVPSQPSPRAPAPPPSPRFLPHPHPSITFERNRVLQNLYLKIFFIKNIALCLTD